MVRTCNNLLQYSAYSWISPSALTMISLYSPLIACISAIRSIPVFGAGFGGGAGGVSAEGDLDPSTAEEALPRGLLEEEPASGEWYASFASWNVNNAVNKTISNPLRSSISNLQ